LGLASHKISTYHLDLLAIVYIRQSSLQQVFEHAESRARQYELVDWAAALGWDPGRVLTIDDDQGLSGQTAAQRTGFQRLLAEVSMGHVGLVLGLEMSRLARSSADFQRLLEVCALRGTLIADQEGVYDPRDANDRLLLGLKGTMSEFELLTMRQRLHQGARHKAQRAALFHGTPTGYVKTGKDQVDLDPDEQVRAVVRLIFAKYEELGSVGAVWRYLVRNGIHIGVRRGGSAASAVQWRRGSRSFFRQMLRNPTYAGAYAYGRKRTGQGTLGWQVLEQGRLPAYISWEQYLGNQERMRRSRSVDGSPGVARQGPALLSGLVHCAACGHRMAVQYHKQHGRPQYRCRWLVQQGQGGSCGGSSAEPVDALVTEQVLRALEPAALELHVKAVEDIQQERARLDEQWRCRLERARYEAARVERQYQAVEPENRLVARTLEQRWEEALQQARQLEEEYDRFAVERPRELTQRERDLIEGLSREVPQLWRAESTTAAERKEVVRCLVERVVLGTRRGSEQTQVVIHWQGGAHSEHVVARPVRDVREMSGAEGLLKRLAELRAEEKTAKQIADCLNREGFVPPQRRGPFNADGVRQLLVRQGLASGRKQRHALGEHEWWLADLEKEVGVPEGTMRRWLRLGWVNGRQTPVQHFWVVWADPDELRRLRKLRELAWKKSHSIPQELKTPKERN
jgi:DNA invertase Pin-like site-specific DNA recombinase